MTKATRTKAREAIKDKGLAAVLRIPKGTLTHKQRKFAEALVLDEMTGADAYRAAYDAKGKPKTIGDNASRLKADSRIQAEIDALERAKQLSAWHSAESLRSLVISTLTDIATKEDAKDATRVAAVKVLGTVVGVDAFRETKRIEHVKDSGELREQIMSQLKTMMLGTDDAETVDADSLLAEIAGETESGSEEPHPTGETPNAERDSDASLHTIQLEPSQQNSIPESSDPDPSEHPPSSSESKG